MESDDSLLKEKTTRALTVREAIRRAQAIVRSYIPQGGRRLSDELIEERRKESRDE
jgi:hypothetical protein